MKVTCRCRSRCRCRCVIILFNNKGTDSVQTSFQTCAKIQGISWIQDPQDLGPGILTDPGLAFWRRIQWTLDLVHAVFATSRGSFIYKNSCWILGIVDLAQIKFLGSGGSSTIFLHNIMVAKFVDHSQENHMWANHRKLSWFRFLNYLIWICGQFKNGFLETLGANPPISKMRDSNPEGFAISRPTISSICNYIYKCVFDRLAKFRDLSVKSRLQWRHKIRHISKFSIT